LVFYIGGEKEKEKEKRNKKTGPSLQMVLNGHGIT